MSENPHPNPNLETEGDSHMEEDPDSEGLEGDGLSDPGNDQHALANPQGSNAANTGSNNQLTLSFQGEVYVFESVSPEKVQAVLLLLGGREVTTPVSSSSLVNSKRTNLPHRVASLMRFREKRKERNFDKKIRYTVRKEVAQRMQRSKGQFVSSKSKNEDGTPGDPGWEGTQNWGSLDKQLPASTTCHHCCVSAKNTPMMRRGPDGPRTLCNACGLVWANKGIMRDLSKSPMNPSIDPALVNDGNNAVGVEPMQPLTLTENGHDHSS